MVIWGLLLFIAGCVIADTARQYNHKRTQDFKSFCDFLKLKSIDSDARCGHLVGATVIILNAHIFEPLLIYL